MKSEFNSCEDFLEYLTERGMTKQFPAQWIRFDDYPVIFQRRILEVKKPYLVTMVKDMEGPLELKTDLLMKHHHKCALPLWMVPAIVYMNGTFSMRIEETGKHKGLPGEDAIKKYHLWFSDETDMLVFKMAINEHSDRYHEYLRKHNLSSF